MISVCGNAADWKVEQWFDCYARRHNGLLTRHAIRHPAKMAVPLTERILDRGAVEGWWRQNDLLLDFFAGAGTTLLVGARRGYRVFGIELVQKYIDSFYGFECDGAADAACDYPKTDGGVPAHSAHTVKGSLGLNLPFLCALGLPMPVMVQGDARNMRDVLDRAFCGRIVSPPYAESITYQRAGAGGEGNELLRAGLSPQSIKQLRKTRDPRVLRARRDNGYSRDPNNVGNLPTGSHATVMAAIVSPAYSETRIGTHSCMGNTGVRKAYEPAEGQLGRMREGQFEEVVGTVNAGKMYGETYWGAIAMVYAGAREVIEPNGMLVLVVKDFVRKRRRVELCRQTIELLRALGYGIELEVHAMLVKENRRTDLFGVEHVSKKTTKSYFRKLAERQGAPPIDYEVVIFARNCA